VLFAGAFFAEYAANVVFLMYGISFAAAFFVSLLFRKTLFRGPEHPFVMELPPYRVPTLRSVAIHMWEKAKHYIRRIGTIVLLFSMVLYFLSHYPKGPDGGIEHTAAGAVGRALEPAIAPAGFDWRMGVSLVTGFVAKEMVVGTMGVLYGTEDPAGRGNGALAETLRSRYSALQAFAFMIFALIYTPCLASVITLIREIKSSRWSLFAVIYPVVLAWLAATAVYRGGTLLGFGN
jgi:ferrous iron transport protein B